jgi:hypothetical protein
MHVFEVYGADGADGADGEPDLDFERGCEFELEYEERGGVGVEDAKCEVVVGMDGCELEERAYVVVTEAEFEDPSVP